MKKILCKKFIKKAVAFGLVICTIVGVAIRNNNLNVEASEKQTHTELDEEKIKNDDYTKFVQKFRKDGVDITITSLEELYDEFNSYEKIDVSLRKDILSKATDEVIMQFLLEEEKEMFEFNEQIEADNVFLDTSEKNVVADKDDFIQAVDIDYYKKGEDSYKKVTKYSSKYGSEFEIIVEDTKEEITKGGYEKVGTPKNEVTYKDYGDRKFSYLLRTELAYMDSTLGYTLSYGKVEYRYMQVEYGDLAPGVKSVELQDKDCTKSEVTNNGDAISAYAIYNMRLVPAFFGGLENCHYKIVLSVVKGGDSNSTWKCGMTITQKAQAYRRKW